MSEIVQDSFSVENFFGCLCIFFLVFCKTDNPDILLTKEFTTN